MECPQGWPLSPLCINTWQYLRAEECIKMRACPAADIILLAGSEGEEFSSNGGQQYDDCHRAAVSTGQCEVAK